MLLAPAADSGRPPPSPQAFIKEVAAKAKTWTPGVNQRFVGATVDNVRRLMGTKRDAARHARLPSVAHCDAACAAAIPATFNASAAFPWATSISFIRDQSDCGS